MPTVVWNVSEAEREEALASRKLIVLLHGYGSHERDLFGLEPLLPAGVVIAAVRAPIDLGGGYSWFPIGVPGEPGIEGANAATAELLEWLDTLQTASAPWVLGFSQGAAMTLQLMRTAPERFSAFVALSGFSVPGEVPGDAALETLLPPVFWGLDLADPVVPPAAVERTAEWLPRHATVTRHEYSGLGHSISVEEMADVVEFLEQHR